MVSVENFFIFLPWNNIILTGRHIYLNVHKKRGAGVSVYIESYLLLNFIMDCTLLRLCAALGLIGVRWHRIAWAGVLGAVFSAIYQIFAWSPLMSLPCAAAMVLIAFGVRGRWVMLRLFVCFYASAFLCGGTGYSFMYALGVGNFPAWCAPLTSLFVYGMVLLYLSRSKKRQIDSWTATLVLVCDGHDCELPAYVDSGNCLTEPVSMLPVAVCSEPRLAHQLKPTHRYVPFKTVGSEGILPLYRADAAYVLKNGERKRIGDFYVAFDTSANMQRNGMLLVPPSIFQ